MNINVEPVNTNKCPGLMCDKHFFETTTKKTMRSWPMLAGNPIYIQLFEPVQRIDDNKVL